MNLLIFDNSKYKKEHLHLSNEMCKYFEKVYYVCNPYNINEKKQIKKNLIPIEYSYKEYTSNFYITDDNISLCLGLNESVAPFVASYCSSHRNTIGYCIVDTVCFNSLVPKDSTYIFDYSNEVFYWGNCFLEINKAIFFSEKDKNSFLKMFNVDCCVIDDKEDKEIANIIWTYFIKELDK